VRVIHWQGAWGLLSGAVRAVTLVGYPTENPDVLKHLDFL